MSKEVIDHRLKTVEMVEKLHKTIYNQDQKISDLETKLAESEKKAYSRGHSQRDIANEIKLNALREDVANKEKRIVELKQQLAEKDKEISEYIKIVDDLHKQLSDKCDFCDKTKDQDKISFAIAELEKVKSVINTSVRDDHIIWDFDIKAHIDNQIKQLKEMK